MSLLIYMFIIASTICYTNYMKVNTVHAFVGLYFSK